MKRAEIAALIAAAEQAEPNPEWAERLRHATRALDPRNPREAELWHRGRAALRRHQPPAATPERREHPDPQRYAAFAAWRDRWGAEAAEREAENEKVRVRQRRLAGTGPRPPRTEEDRAAADAVERSLREGLHNDAGEFHRDTIAPLHEAIHAARLRGDARAWEGAMGAAEGIMARFPHPLEAQDHGGEARLARAMDGWEDEARQNAIARERDREEAQAEYEAQALADHRAEVAAMPARAVGFGWRGRRR